MGLASKINEKKQKKLEAEETAKAEAEFEANYVAKQEKKKVEKNIIEIDKSIENFMKQAAEAKNEGYEDVYRKCVAFIKTAKVRRKQARCFLFQIDSMIEMQNISKNSNELLSSMNSVMNTLGKLSIDKAVMAQTQKDFRQAQIDLDKQSQSIDSFLSQVDSVSSQSDDMDNITDESIEEEIARSMCGNINASSSNNVSSSSNDDAEMKRYEKLLNN